VAAIGVQRGETALEVNVTVAQRPPRPVPQR